MQNLGVCFFFLFRSRRGSPACITPKCNCPTSPVDAPKAIQPTTEQATGEHGAVQPGPPRCTWNAATYTASQHLCEGPGALLPRHGHPSSLLAADPGPNCPGILIPLLVFLRRVTPLYNLVVGGPVRGPHGGTHPKAVSRGQTHPASGPFLPRHAALKARPLEQSGPHTGTLTHRVNTTGYPW